MAFNQHEITHVYDCDRLAADASASAFEGDPLALFAEQRSKISAEIPVAAPPDVLWGVLTDYDAHIFLMPNLEQCERLPSRRPDTVLLYQKVFSQTPFWRMEASAVLEIHESSAPGWRKTQFRMLSGDFDELSGQWVVVPDSNDPQNSSILKYEIVLLPLSKALLPSSLRHFLLKRVFPGNILALATYAERLSQVLPTIYQHNSAPPGPSVYKGLSTLSAPRRPHNLLYQRQR